MNIRSCMLRLFSLFVVLCVIFSNIHIVHATELDNLSSFYGVNYEIFHDNPNIALFATQEFEGYTCKLFYYDSSGVQVDITSGVIDLELPDSYYSDNTLRLKYRITLPEVIPSGDIIDLSVGFTLPKGTLTFQDMKLINSNWGNVTYTVGSNRVSISGSTGRNTIQNLTVNGAVKMIDLVYNFVPDSSVTAFTSEFNQITISEVSEKGLLGSIIEIIRSIWTGITELPQKIANSIKGFFDNVVNALKDLGNFIIEGIKSLFIPTEQDIVDIQDDWETLLEDRFGALYECIDIVTDYANTFQSQEKNTITMPTLNLELAGETFAFGGWEVQVVPSGFTSVFTSLKLIISISCTFLFVNGLKNRFEKLIGGSSNI